MSDQRWPRLALFAGLAASQISLFGRFGGTLADGLLATVIWLAAGLLLFQRQPGGAPNPAWALPLAVLLLGWCLAVLNLAANLYDPLLHALPLAALPALALLTPGGLARPLLGRLLVLAALLPLQSRLEGVLLQLPLLAESTARLATAALWLGGHDAVARGKLVVMPEQVVSVESGCIGIATLLLCAVVLLALALVPPGGLALLRRRPAQALVLLAVVLGVAFSINALRVAVLCLAMPPEATAAPWWQNFAFWHDGEGAQLFSLAAVASTLGLWELAHPDG